MEISTEKKCFAIIKKIVEMNQDINDKQGVLFTPDWAGNSISVFTKNGHAHFGDPDGTFTRLINELHFSLCEQKN